jgi:ribonuclease P protein subunit POP4
MDKKILAKDELIGQRVRITDCSDPNWIGKSGQIIDETKNTFLIEIEKQYRKIVKKTARFEFKIHGNKIIIEGSRIAFRPEDRIKKLR